MAVTQVELVCRGRISLVLEGSSAAIKLLLSLLQLIVHGSSSINRILHFMFEQRLSHKEAKPLQRSAVATRLMKGKMSNQSAKRRITMVQFFEEDIE